MSVVIAWAGTACTYDRPSDSSNRGSGSESHPAATSVENAYLVPRFMPGSCVLQVGRQGELRFTVTNNAPVGVERLLDVSTAYADTVRIRPKSGIEVKPGRTVGVGQPEPMTAGETRSASVLLIGLDREVQPATSIEATFVFLRAGIVPMRVPVEACPDQE